MNSISKPIILTGILLATLVSACNMRAADLPQSTATPMSSTATTSPTQTVTAAPSATPAVIASATPEYAPLCEAGASASAPGQCRELTAVQTSTFCTNKKPFNIIFIPKGSTYQALTKGFYCTDGGVRDDKQIITCTGIMASIYQVSICDPTCVVPTVAASITQCPPEHQYDIYKGCCTQDFVQLQQNCRVFEFESSTCKVDCSVHTRKKDCLKNSYACIWNPDAEPVKCLERK